MQNTNNTPQAIEVNLRNLDAKYKTPLGKLGRAHFGILEAKSVGTTLYVHVFSISVMTKVSKEALQALLDIPGFDSINMNTEDENVMELIINDFSV